MTGEEIYDRLMANPEYQRLVDEDNYSRLYRKLLVDNSDIKVSDLYTFFKDADIDITWDGTVPVMAFAGNKAISAFDFSKVTNINLGAFRNSGIKEVNIKNVKEVGRLAFAGSDAEEVYLPSNGVVEPGAFSDCRNIRELYVPAGVKLGQSAFGRCINMGEIYFENGFDFTGATDKCFNYIRKITYVTATMSTAAEYQGFARMFSDGTEISELYIEGPRDPEFEKYISEYSQIKVGSVQFTQ